MKLLWQLRRAWGEWIFEIMWTDRAVKDWRRLLAAHPPTVNGVPNPEVTALLGNIDTLLKISPQLGTRVLLEGCRRVVLALGIPALAFVMFTSCEHNSVALAAKADFLSFTLDSDTDAPVLREVPFKQLVVEPVDEFHPCSEKSGPLAGSSLDGGTATVVASTVTTLNAIKLPRGTNVSFGLAKDPQGMVVSFEYPGLTDIVITGTASKTCGFEIVTRARAITLTIQAAGTELSEPTDGQIPISALEFILPQANPGRSLSSIHSGTLSFTDIPDLKYSLDRGARLSINLEKGTLADVRVIDRKIALLLQGDTRKVLLGYRDQVDITPTRLDRIRTKSRNIELWLGLAVFALLLYGFVLPTGAKA